MSSTPSASASAVPVSTALASTGGKSLSKAGMVKFKNSARGHQDTEQVVAFIVARITDLHNWAALRKDPELVRYILTAIQNGLVNKTPDEQVALCQSIMLRLFPDLSNDEMDAFAKVCIFLLQNDMVQDITCLSHTWKRVQRFFFPKPASS